MRLLGNIIWIILGGFITAAGFFLAGCLFCITIIGIPIGKQLFKFASLNLTPFGKKVDINFAKHPIMNVIWLLIIGVPMAVTHIGEGIAFCVTIIGIPFGLQHFKLVMLSLMPFGANIRK